MKTKLLLCSLLLPPLLGGCVVRPFVEIKEIKSAAQNQEQGEEPVVVTSIMDLRQNDLKKEAKALLGAGDYAEIEKRVTAYRRKREEFLDGTSKLAVFYSGLSSVRSNASDAEWVQLEKRLQDWHKKHPESLTADVALAMAYFDGAYLARGFDYADKVKPEQWDLMEKRLALAAKSLTGAMSLKANSPGWYMAALDAMFLQSVERSEYDAVRDEALARFPQYTDFHLRTVHYLMDRWYGEPGEWQEYAAKQAARLPRDQGDILYARLVWQVIRMVDTPAAPELRQFDWQRAKRGFDLLLVQPESHAASGAFTMAAWIKRDRPTLKRLFEQQIGNHIDYAVWKSKADFQKARQWALEENE